MDPLMYEAATSGDLHFLETNTSHGYLFTQKTPKENNILHLAAEFKHIDFFSKVPLSDQSPLFWARNKNGDSPLHVAAGVGCDEVTEFLIEHAKGSKELLGSTNSQKDTAMHVAARFGHNGVVSLLITAYPELCCFTNNANESPLFIAIRKGFHQVARSILNSPIPPSFEGTRGVTALHAAVTHGNIKIRGLVKIMVRKESSISSQRDDIGWTPLHYAALAGNLDVTRILLHSNSSISYILDKSGMSALHVAASVGRIAILKELLQCRPDSCDLLNDKGQNILHVAVLGIQGPVVKYIMKAPKLGRLINEADKHGNTPLHLAAAYLNARRCRNFTTDPRVDKSAINNEFLHPVDIHFKVKKTPYFSLGTSAGVPFFHEKILHYIMASESEEMDMSSTRANSCIVKTRVELQEKGGIDPTIYNTNQLVATLIATVTFTAAFTIPGGFKSDGTPVLLRNAFLILFLLFDAFSFFLSSYVVFNYFLIINRGAAYPINHVLFGTTYWALGAMVVAFSLGICAMVVKSSIPLAILFLVASGCVFYYFGRMFYEPQKRGSQMLWLRTRNF